MTEKSKKTTFFSSEEGKRVRTEVQALEAMLKMEGINDKVNQKDGLKNRKNMTSHNKTRTIDEWMKLASDFAPVVQLCGTTIWYDQYHPSSVEWYLQRSSLKDRNNSKVNIKNPGPEDFKRHNSKSAYLDPKSHSFRGDLSGAKFYVHVVEVPKDPDHVDLQYWFFYPYNGKTPTTVAPAGVFGSHEGDWEHIVIRIHSSGKKIKQVYFAAHGSDEGRWVKKSTKKIADSDHYKINGKSVEVYSAWHSHASYVDLGLHWRSKTVYISNDYCAGGTTWQGEVEIISIDPKLLPQGIQFNSPEWLLWKGRWGSTLQSWDHWFGNSPTGPSSGRAWHPDTDSDSEKWSAWLNLDPPNNAFLLRNAMNPCPQGKLTFLGFDKNDLMLIQQQAGTQSGWSSWKVISHEGLFSGEDFSLILTPKDQLAVFVLNIENQVECGTQINQRDKTFWEWSAVSKAPNKINQFEVIAGFDGRIHVFALVSDGPYLSKLFYTYQDDVKEAASWAPFTQISELSFDNICVQALNDGSLAVVASSEKETVIAHRTLGDPKASFNFNKFPHKKYRVKSLQLHADGRLELFAVHKDKIIHSGQKKVSTDFGKKSNWHHWKSIGKLKNVNSISTASEADGTIAVFALTRDLELYRTRIKQADGWAPWQLMHENTSSFAVAKNADGRLEIMSVIGVGKVAHSWQLKPFLN